MQARPTKPTFASYDTGSVVSKDGTTITYRRFGHGPPVVLVHGGMQAAQNLMKLGEELSDAFTVFIPDRRGRGLSGQYRKDHSIITDCEDIEAILSESRAGNLFGLSSGALLSLWTALESSNVRKLAIYEPPLPIDGNDPAGWLPRFDREISERRLGAALVTVVKGTRTSPMLGLVPRFLLAPFLNLVVEAEAKKVKAGDVSMREIIPTMHFDAKTVSDSTGSLDRFRAITAEVLLLGGSKSPRYLKAALDALEKTLTDSRRVEFPGVGHLAADNGGKPALVARELRSFFGE